MPSKVWRCALKFDDLFEKKCPLKWESLAETSNPKVRQCGVCNRDVHQCDTPDEFIESTKEGLCIAIPGNLDIEGGVSDSLGQPLPWSYSLEAHAQEWWGLVDKKSFGQIDQQIRKDLKMKETRRYMESKAEDS